VAPNVFAPTLAMALPRNVDAPPGLVAITRPAPSTTFLTFNLARPPLDRSEVRRAISRALDRAALVAAKLAGAGQIARGFLPDLIALAPRGRPLPIFDLASARESLRGAQGPLELVVGSQRPRIALARAIAQMLGDAGLEVEVRPYELGTLTARLAAGSFDLAVQQAIELDDPEMMRWYFHSSALPPNGANRGRVIDAEIDALLDRGLATLDPEARRPIYEEVERRIAEDALVAPLFHEDHVAVVGPRAAGFRPSADGRWAALARL
jgi:peptide/nickel transport system substrate-binding protein